MNHTLVKFWSKFYVIPPHLEEEVLDRGGDGIYGDVEAVEVDVCVLVKLLEEQVHVRQCDNQDRALGQPLAN